MGLEPQTSRQRHEVQRSESGTLSLSGSTQGLLSGLRPPSAYLDVVGKLRDCEFGESMTLGQPGSLVARTRGLGSCGSVQSVTMATRSQQPIGGGGIRIVSRPRTRLPRAGRKAKQQRCTRTGNRD